MLEFALKSNFNCGAKNTKHFIQPEIWKVNFPINNYFAEHLMTPKK